MRTITETLQPDVSYRVRQRLGPLVTRFARRFGQPEYRLRDTEYVGTVQRPLDEFTETLQEHGFEWDPLAWYHQPPVGSEPDGSWTYQRSLLADRQTDPRHSHRSLAGLRRRVRSRGVQLAATPDQTPPASRYRAGSRGRRDAALDREPGYIDRYQIASSPPDLTRDTRLLQVSRVHRSITWTRSVPSKGIAGLRRTRRHGMNPTRLFTL